MSVISVGQQRRVTDVSRPLLLQVVESVHNALIRIEDYMQQTVCGPVPAGAPDSVAAGALHTPAVEVPNIS
jgi:hypothetical protein